MKINETMKEFLQRANIIYVATSDKDGIPHLAAGERIVVADGEHVKLEAWFCVKTIENLMVDPAIAIAAIDPSTKDGFQLIGKVEKIDEKMVMDGYIPAMEEKWAGVSITEYTVTVIIGHVLKFTTDVHSDLPLSND